MTPSILIATAWLITNWYLNKVNGWLETPKDDAPKIKMQQLMKTIKERIEQIKNMRSPLFLNDMKSCKKHANRHIEANAI